MVLISSTKLTYILKQKDKSLEKLSERKAIQIKSYWIKCWAISYAFII